MLMRGGETWKTNNKDTGHVTWMRGVAAERLNRQTEQPRSGFLRHVRISFHLLRLEPTGD